MEPTPIEFTVLRYRNRVQLTSLLLWAIGLLGIGLGMHARLYPGGVAGAAALAWLGMLFVAFRYWLNVPYRLRLQVDGLVLTRVRGPEPPWHISWGELAAYRMTGTAQGNDLQLRLRSRED
ncbi:hypothetical protein [Hymenobacter sp. B81]|uniref:hypothetical protein n=1 Tax=Hymenobacter sp. B81 TaxID=3344878 RepID=UPI0037DCFFF1